MNIFYNFMYVSFLISHKINTTGENAGKFNYTQM